MRYFRLSILVVAIAILSELLAGYLYFQLSWEKGIASLWLTERIINNYFVNENSESTTVTKKDYKLNFSHFVEEAKKRHIKVIILYIPLTSSSYSSQKIFFQSIAKINDIRFFDTTKTIAQYNVQYVYNLPADPHLSRLGHQVIAQFLEDKLLQLNLKHRLTESINPETTAIHGPHPKNIDQLRQYAGRGYRVQTNHQGFRMTESIINHDKPKKILVLGDSFTFGTGINTEESYPNILNKKLEDSLVINAGIPGGGIIEELEVYNEFIKSIVPNIIIVQVSDNDLVSPITMD